MIDLTNQAVAILLLTLRVVPVLAFSPPFTLLRIPAIVRVLMSVAMATWIVAGSPATTSQADFWAHGLFLTAIGELMLGISLALALQFAFAALLTVGRAIDIQAGFGLAVLVDPTTKSQMPLVGTVFAYAAAAIFFAGTGPTDLLAIWSASVEQIPLGSAAIGGDVGRLVGFISAAFVAACGLGGAIMLALFLTDLTIAFMSRTLPQMNVMLLGFQVKALVTLALLPMAVAIGGSMFAHLLRLALEAGPAIMMGRGMAEGQDQNRTEEATPFKLKQARGKGMVARGLDLGFVAGLVGLAAFATMAGVRLIELLATTMRRALTAGIGAAADPQGAASLSGQLLWPLLTPIALFGVTLLAVVLLVEIVQLRGLSFSAFPLKPDFSRLNPAKGLKRIFSMRMLKEAFKAILKMTVYTTVAVMVIRAAVNGQAIRITDATSLSTVLHDEGMRLLLIFIVVAIIFATIDQVLARGEFRKQMRMSKRELTREHKEREGDPRQKSKRKQFHAEFVKQAKGLGNLPGSDLMIVNPRHVAVALAYRPGEMAAPEVTAKATDRQALQLKAAARRHRIPIFEMPALARAIFRETEMGQAIAPSNYHAVAQLYYKLQENSS